MKATLDGLIDKLIQGRVLKTPSVIEAFKKIDRKDFVKDDCFSEAYENYPLPIGFDQTISQPMTVAFMLKLLQPEKGERILDLGSGSGWTTALLAQIVGPEGRVWGVERIPELVELGQKNLNKYKFKNSQILESTEDLGLSGKAPFDKILVSAGAEQVPNELVWQLKIGGIIVIPVGSTVLKIKRVSKSEIQTEKFEGFAFVPLLK